MITKTITIKDEHGDFIEEISLNLSRFVQKKLDEEKLWMGQTEAGTSKAGDSKES